MRHWSGILALVAAFSSGAAEWTWLEKDALPLEGKAFRDVETYYCRMPVRAKGKVSPGVYGQGRQSTGMYIRFTTDANRLALRWKVANENPRDPLIPEAGMSGIDVYRYESSAKRWVFIGNKRYWGNGARLKVPGEAEISWNPGQPGLIYLPTRSQVLDFKIGVPAGKTLKAFPHADPAAKPVVHYGTSIVHGGCASRPGLTFTAIAGRELDRPYINLGFSGSGKMEENMVPYLAEIDAAVYVVDCIWNMDKAMIQTNAVRFLEALHAAKPETPILLCEGCTQLASRRRAVDDVLRAEYDRIKTADPAKWRNLYYFDAKDMLPVDDECTHDFCHPNDDGMRHMGPVYVTRIREVLEAAKASAGMLSVDFSQVVGPVKPVNGVGQPPTIGWNNFSLFHYLKEAGIPYSRLHDTGGPFDKNIYVDIPNLFRDFDADETDPKNYDFAFTDQLISNLVVHAVEPYFRLGITIENSVNVRGYRVDPPKDYAKWARICEHVIRHYTEGWANGFRHKISHWEIWNEPENHPDPKLNPMWNGDWDSYLRLYLVTSKHLKKCFPHLMIGGYASCGFYAVDGTGQVADGANVGPRKMHFVHCFTNFLDVVRREKAPLDFFSNHSYAAPKTALIQATWARARLDEYGFKDVPLSMNEWLPQPGHGRGGTIHQAAMIAAEMIGFQNGPVADAEIYDARCGLGNYSPLFDGITHKPRKAYYVFLAFNELRKLGQAVRVTGAPEELWAAAATDGRKGAVMLANISGGALPIPQVFGGRKVTRVRAIDAENDFAVVSAVGSIANDAVLLIECE